MTLLADRIRADKRFAKRFSDADQEQVRHWLTSEYTPVYEISNVTTFLRNHGMDFTRLGCFPNVAPPHIIYWMEWHGRATAVPFMASENATDPERMGVLVWQNEPDGKGAWPVTISAWGLWGRRAVPVCAWHVVMNEGGYPEILKTRVWPEVPALFEHKVRVSTGEVELPQVESREHARRLIEQKTRELAEAEADMERINQKLCDVYGDWLKLGVLYPVLMAHSLMACRNVATELNEPSRKLSRAHARRHGEPLVTFSTLRIGGIGGVASSAGLTGDQRLHIVRGHFKTFTPERPLFGRHSGTYWWPSTVKGNREKGIVVKDYELAVSPSVLAGGEQPE